MAFQQGLSGLNIASKALDAISNNVANSTTVGFKQSQAQFADIYATTLGGGTSNQIGIGARVNGVAQQFSQGNITVTSNPLDIAINGEGFFRMNNNGDVLYSRNGQFNVDKNGYIVNGSGYRLTGYGTDANDNIVVTAPIDLRIDTALTGAQPSSTTLANLAVNLDSRLSPPATTPFSPTDTSSFSYSTSLTAYDSLGNPHIMSMYFVKSATANQWDLHTSLDGGAATAATTLTFNSNGGLVGPTTVAQSFAVGTGATTPLAFDLDLTGSTQYGTTFSVNSVGQDGYTSGRLSGLTVSPEGIVQGRYTNGQSRNIGQVVLATFQNPDGMVQLGSNAWAETSFSGPPAVGAPATGNRGGLQPGAVEDSNVDLTAELVNMITQQRAYQANAQSIKTQDQILQTLVNLR
ncbi:MAG: flagellar hook protein FlgE [Methyloversatilis sp.]|jgi:flagellar hook protein FlgE|uniref:Flagellar hook protein FlgE n=1 Tax=Methyloversatilis universalis (strain ATCC BAA-1314 / DSM 25237 / JCM 13912 / CCUG 52030 / FAM5) TaxID=1000565 RepID=F5REC5_METUF|nr:flagellar hook protein FlgE [Methyloversatilis universalis]EGK71256.1 Flagellar hook protein FlgE [Methyloversatilis universalis FAM5]MCP4636069.1 flagellar hook protein FlgE [Methyloversatilis sp.]